MEKQVHVRLTTIIRQPGEQEQKTEFRARGTLTEKNGRRYLRYAENQDGLDIRTMVKLGETEAVIVRSGGLQMRLPFILNKEQTGNYTNEHSFMLTTKTHELHVSNTRLHVRYDLVIGADYIGEYEMEIQFTEGSA